MAASSPPASAIACIKKSNGCRLAFDAGASGLDGFGTAQAADALTF
jgi:hypothetical protein